MHNILTFIFNQITPPAGFPASILVVLIVFLPWIYKNFLERLTGTVKFTVCAILSSLVAFLCVIIAGIPLNVGNWFKLFYILFTWSQFIYHIMVKPIANAVAKKKKNGVVI